mmetsp:Transcript_139457/g.446141  ORF Transcript_139457/g.446141 Transcript_139457/m.446141 type:complete len:400 (-) Transcript_139457:289-1488(-)
MCWAGGGVLPRWLLYLRRGVTQQVRERRAARHFDARWAGRICRALACWNELAVQARAQRLWLEWHRGSRVSRIVLRGWCRGVQLHVFVRSCTRRRCLVYANLCLRSWRLTLLARRVACELRRGALLAWRHGMEQGRRARDATLRGRWADEVAEAFASRRVLKVLASGLQGWSTLARDASSFSSRLQSRHRAILLRSTFDALWCWHSLRRLSSALVPLDRCRARGALRRLRVVGKGMAVAQLHRQVALRPVWQSFARIARQRQGVSRIVRLLTDHLGAHALSRLAAEARRLREAELRGSEAAAQRRRSRALGAWRSRHTLLVCRTLLPGILEAWRRVCRVEALTRRSRRRRGLCAWRAFLRSRLSERRRRVLAELWAARRRRMKPLGCSWNAGARRWQRR